MEKLTFKRCEVKFNFGDRQTHTPQIVALLWTVIETKGRVHVKKSKKLWKFSSLGCPPPSMMENCLISLDIRPFF